MLLFRPRRRPRPTRRRGSSRTLLARRCRRRRPARRRRTTRCAAAAAATQTSTLEHSTAPRTSRSLTLAQDAEPCLPLPRLVDYGLDITTDAIDGAQTEERASCLFARRALDEKRRASACFAHIAYPYPP